MSPLLAYLLFSLLNRSIKTEWKLTWWKTGDEIHCSSCEALSLLCLPHNSLPSPCSSSKLTWWSPIPPVPLKVPIVLWPHLYCTCWLTVQSLRTQSPGGCGQVGLELRPGWGRGVRPSQLCPPTRPFSALCFYLPCCLFLRESVTTSWPG